MKTLALFYTACLIIMLVGILINNAYRQPIKDKAIETLTAQRDSLIMACHAKDSTIALLREHMGQCSFIARKQVKTVTNGRWIELKHNFDMLIAHQDLSIENLMNMSPLNK
jgi:hypothetical protein